MELKESILPGGVRDSFGGDISIQENGSFDLSFSGSAEDKWEVFPECPLVELLSQTSAPNPADGKSSHTLTFLAKSVGMFELRMCRFDGRAYEGGRLNPVVQEAIMYRIFVK